MITQYIITTMSRDIYRKNLNPSQLEAVFYTDSPLLVLAGAGSGKTRVITYKIIYLISECGLDPRSILAVTFTNKAAGEMKERVDQLLGETTNIMIKTFHSFAARMLRGFGESLGVDPRFTIIDQQDQTRAVREIIEALKLDKETYRPEQYVHLINRAKDRLYDADQAYREEFSTDQEFYEIYQKYEKTLQKEKLLDFGDLIFKLVRGLSQNRKLLTYLKDGVSYILVDEFQD
ncbi:MAG: ATP-dependent helicase, partial [Spirochaetota bacterium]